MAYKTVTIKEARDNFSEIIERAAIAGDVFVVTKFGKRKAKISANFDEDNIANSDHKEKARAEWLKSACGMWKDRADIGSGVEWERKIRSKRRYNGKIFD